MPAGPNQTGKVLVPSLSQALGYGAGLTDQETDEQRRQRLLREASAPGGVAPQSLVSNLFNG